MLLALHIATAFHENGASVYSRMKAEFGRLIDDVRANASTRAAQMHILDAAGPFWRAAQRRKGYRMRGDLTMYRQWKAWTEAGNIPSALYIPFPWHFLIEERARDARDPRLLLAAIDAINQSIAKEHLHFVTLQQASLWQISQLLPRLKAGLQHLFLRIAIVFDGRGDNRQMPRAAHVPIPLLWDRELPLQRAEIKKPAVMFAGKCTSAARCALTLALFVKEATSVTFRRRQSTSGNDSLSWNATRPCQFSRIKGSKEARLSAQAFYREQGAALWFIAARGTFPASFNMYETLQQGSLPVHLWNDEPSLLFKGAKRGCERRIRVGRPGAFSRPWLPYADIHVDFNQFGIVLHASDVWSLQGRLETISRNETDALERLRRVERLRSLFTPRGVAHYIRYHVARLLSTRRISSPFKGGPGH